MKLHEENRKEGTRNSGNENRNKTAKNRLEEDLILQELRVEDETISKLIEIHSTKHIELNEDKKISTFLANIKNDSSISADYSLTNEGILRKRKMYGTQQSSYSCT
ncbi:hypothetical protein CEXT_94821 [Caerostris extrusa]|uniref:Uncharacterized protein n=1 Tax=Caerostris extrusa TaxID=172846 RepID=A0AAV4QTI3_CAEEX|nr:hypothetical protein CEXT_94821 [Caerostris extrusa]